MISEVLYVFPCVRPSTFPQLNSAYHQNLRLFPEDTLRLELAKARPPPFFPTVIIQR